MVNGHYQVPVPWKLDWRQLPCNRHLAEKRLSFLRTRSAKNESPLQRYGNIIADYERKGYGKRLRGFAATELRFIPHHSVVNPHKPEKLRIVFDCAVRCGGTSLNDCIFSGPDLSNDIIGVLMRCRLHEIAMSADIEEMFLQVRLSPEDRAPFCFLKYTGSDIRQHSDVYQLNVYPFGATS